LLSEMPEDAARSNTDSQHRRQNEHAEIRQACFASQPPRSATSIVSRILVHHTRYQSLYDVPTVLVPEAPLFTL
jgi:hypothetical protein